MCMICNLTDPQNQVATASSFIGAYAASQRAMSEAIDAMLAVSKLDLMPDDRARYDRAHKQMRRISREWNMIEHTREVGAGHVGNAPL